MSAHLSASGPGGRFRSRCLAQLTRLLVVGAISLAACHREPSAPPPPVTGRIAITVGGLPAGTAASISVSGPGGFTRTLTTSEVLTDLAPGQYVITASEVLTTLSTFAPGIPVQTVTLEASTAGTAIPVSVLYAITNGSLNVVIAGLPSGVSGQIVLSGPDGYADTVSSSAILGHLQPGIYQVEANTVQSGHDLYRPQPSTFTVAVAASVTSTQAVVGYSLVSGSLSVLVNGLPSGATADVAIAGPEGFSGQLGGSITLDGLLEGRYVLTASGVTEGSTSFLAQPASQAVMVSPGTTGSVAVNYSPADGSAFDLFVNAVQVQQVVQTYGDAVPLVAGHDGLLRVFARATQLTSARPPVRVWLYDEAGPVSTVDLPTPVGGVPVSIDEGDLGSSWNYDIPAAVMRPGLRVLVEIDPDNAVAEASETNNLYPSSGTPLTLDVRAMPPLALRLVPVMQTATGLMGDVTAGNLPQFLAVARKLMPVSGVTADVRAPYTTSAPALEANDANGAWLQVLSEIDALRVADGSAAHYYGVVKTSYSQGVIGLASVPGNAAMGWDVFPSAGETLAHELGHNLGRFHSPCGATSALDANYPYSDGSIGVYGYDAAIAALRAPSTPDIMGYCANRWISDYTYAGIVGFLATHTASFPALEILRKNTMSPGLLVFGHIDRDSVVLEPAYVVVAPPRLPEGPGPNRLEVLGPSGEPLAELSFSGHPVEDEGRSGSQTFAFVVPLDAMGGIEPRTIRVAASGGRVASTTSAGAPLPSEFTPSAERLSPDEVQVTWQEGPGRGVLVRDPRSGEILAFGRRGSVRVRTNASSVDLTLSNGARSVRQQLAVRPK